MAVAIAFTIRNLSGYGWDVIENFTTDHLTILINTKVEPLRATPNIRLFFNFKRANRKDLTQEMNKREISKGETEKK